MPGEPRQNKRQRRKEALHLASRLPELREELLWLPALSLGLTLLHGPSGLERAVPAALLD